MEQNRRDGGNRRFILCTNNENNICEEVTYERIKRVIEGYGDTEGIPANLKYYRTDFVSKYSDSLTDELLDHIKDWNMASILMVASISWFSPMKRQMH